MTWQGTRLKLTSFSKTMIGETAVRGFAISWISSFTVVAYGRRSGFRVWEVRSNHCAFVRGVSTCSNLLTPVIRAHLQTRPHPKRLRVEPRNRQDDLRVVSSSEQEICIRSPKLRTTASISRKPKDSNTKSTPKASPPPPPPRPPRPPPCRLWQGSLRIRLAEPQRNSRIPEA